jgi:hypothetical protein
MLPMWLRPLPREGRVCARMIVFALVTIGACLVYKGHLLGGLHGIRMGHQNMIEPVSALNLSTRIGSMGHSINVTGAIRWASDALSAARYDVEMAAGGVVTGAQELADVVQRASESASHSVRPVIGSASSQPFTRQTSS